MKFLELSKNGKHANKYYTTVDDKDYLWLIKYSWHAVNNHGKIYARTAVKRNNKIRVFYLHKVLSGAKKNESTDHIDNNTLNNRRSNLRTCTHAENCRNRRKKSNNKTGYKGVYENINSFGFHAQINHKNLGCFRTAKQAAIAYNQAAIKLYGEFANLNEIK